MAAEAAGRRAMEHGMKKIDVFVKGPGSGRETAIRSLGAIGLELDHAESLQSLADWYEKGTHVKADPAKAGRYRYRLARLRGARVWEAPPAEVELELPSRRRRRCCRSGSSSSR